MKLLIGKQINFRGGKYIVFAQHNEYIATTDEDDMVHFFEVTKNHQGADCVGYCYCFCVTLSRYCEVLDTSKSLIKKDLHHVFGRKYYKMPMFMRDMIIDWYLENK